MPKASRSLLAVNALVFASLIIGLLNNVAIAALFGLTRSVDAFFAALMLPNLVMVLCVDYLGKNFLPLLALAKSESEQSAAEMASSVVTIVALLALVVSAVLAVLARPVFDLLLPGFDHSETALVSRYFWVMAPAIVLMTVNTFHEYVCQYAERFTLVTAIRMSRPAANLVAIVALAPAIGTYCLPVGFLLGHLFSFVLLLRYVGYRYRPRLTTRAHLERRVFTNSAVVMSTGFIARTKSIIMNYLASGLGGGSISALAMTTKLTEPLERTTFAGIHMLMFSRTARLFVERKERALAELYRVGLKVSFVLLAPLLWWIGLNSTEIVRAFFARGQFTPEMTLVVGATLATLAPSVLLIGVNQLLSNAFYAMDRVKVPALVMPLGTVVYLAVAVPLSKVIGVQGLALATTATTASVFVVLYVCIARVLPGLKPYATAVQLAAYVGLGALAMFGSHELLRALGLPLAAVATLGLPLGAALYCLPLALLGDATFRRLLDYARGFVVRNAAA